MTKIAVYDPEIRAPKPETTVYLRLEQQAPIGGTGSILLKAVNENGSPVNCGNLMRFYPDGTFKSILDAEVNGQEFKERERGR